MNFTLFNDFYHMRSLCSVELLNDCANEFEGVCKGLLSNLKYCPRLFKENFEDC